jgi:hypothetical protein
MQQMIIPPSRPKIARSRVAEILDANGCDLTKVNLLGIRAYYLDSMGKPGVNERGVFDDALIWFTPSETAKFNANCDPSRYRKGWGFGAEKGMASLKSGVWSYKTGIHYGKIPHAAFRQAGKVTVIRDGTKGVYEDTGFFGINIHRGGRAGTSSLGCQTLPDSMWSEFKEFGYSALKRENQSTFNYCLVEEVNLRKGQLRVPGL